MPGWPFDIMSVCNYLWSALQWQISTVIFHAVNVLLLWHFHKQQPAAFTDQSLRSGGMGCKQHCETGRQAERRAK